MTLKKKMNTFFGAPEEPEKSETASEAISDAMNDAMAISMPLRNVATFGLCTKEELDEMIDTLNQM